MFVPTLISCQVLYRQCRRAHQGKWFVSRSQNVGTQQTMRCFGWKASTKRYYFFCGTMRSSWTVSVMHRLAAHSFPINVSLDEEDPAELIFSTKNKCCILLHLNVYVCLSCSSKLSWYSFPPGFSASPDCYAGWPCNSICTFMLGN